MPQHPPEDARDLLQRNVRKTVAVSTLKRIRGLVDDYDEEQRLKARLSRRVLVGAIVTVAAIAAALYLSGGGVLRVLTAVLSSLRG